MDWIQEFEKKFGRHQLIARLARLKFHGSLEIHFADGIANTVHVSWVVKPYSSITLTRGEGEGGENG